MSQLTYKNEDIIYQLTVEDIQTVANEELERNLTDEEINAIIDTIAEKIPWFDAIYYAIVEKIEE